MWLQYPVVIRNPSWLIGKLRLPTRPPIPCFQETPRGRSGSATAPPRAASGAKRQGGLLPVYGGRFRTCWKVSASTTAAKCDRRCSTASLRGGILTERPALVGKRDAGVARRGAAGVNAAWDPEVAGALCGPAASDRAPPGKHASSVQPAGRPAHRLLAMRVCRAGGEAAHPRRKPKCRDKRGINEYISIFNEYYFVPSPNTAQQRFLPPPEYILLFGQKSCAPDNGLLVVAVRSSVLLFIVLR